MRSKHIVNDKKTHAGLVKLFFPSHEASTWRRDATFINHGSAAGSPFLEHGL